MTRRQLLASIDARELGYWKAYELVEGPFGDRRADHNAGKIMMHQTAAACPGETFYLKDFLTEWDQAAEEKEPEPRQSEEEMKAEWAAAVEAFNKG
jgi:hypothetical protein